VKKWRPGTQAGVPASESDLKNLHAAHGVLPSIAPQRHSRVHPHRAPRWSPRRRQRINLRDTLYTAGKDKEQITNPLVQDGQKLIPSVTRVFSKTREMLVYLQAYDQTAESAPPLVGYVTFYRGQRKAYETQPVAVTERLNNRLKTAPLKFSIGLGKLPPGRYNCQVTVLDPKSRKAAFWQAPVMVAP
jgi:hypothetical protein